MVSTPASSPQQKMPPLSYADRAKKAQNSSSPSKQPPSQPQTDSQPSSLVAHNPAPSSKPPPVNVWSLRKEQMAAAARSTPQRSIPPSGPPQPPPPPPPPPGPSAQDLPPLAHSSSSSHPSPLKNSPSPKAPSDSAPTTATTAATLGPSVASVIINGTPSFDPFVVRPNINPARTVHAAPPIDKESWPEVGKSIDPPDFTQDSTRPEAPESQSTSTAKKSEKPKWVPIPPEELQAAADALNKPSSRSRQHSHSRKPHHPHPPHSRTGYANSNRDSHGSGSGQGQSRVPSASESRVHSRSESVQSSPRFPTRGRRLPVDDVSTTMGLGTIPSERTISRSGANSPPLQVQPHLQPPPQPIPPAAAETQPAVPFSTPTTNSSAPVETANFLSGMIYPLYPPTPSNGSLPSQYPPHHHHHHPMSSHPPSQNHATHYMPMVIGAGTGGAVGTVGYPPHNSSPGPGQTPPLPPAPAPYVHHHQHSHSHSHPFYPTYSMYPPFDYITHNHSPGSQHQHQQQAAAQQAYGYWSQPGSGHHSPAYPPPHPHHYGSVYGPVYLPQHQEEGPPQEALLGESSSTDVTASSTDDGTHILHTRPPPPELSMPVSVAAVAGYHQHPSAGPVPAPQPQPPSSSITTATTTTTTNTGESSSSIPAAGTSVIFGSIGVPGASACPSPALIVPNPNENNAERKKRNYNNNISTSTSEGGLAKFSVGVTPGESAARARSRTHSNHDRGGQVSVMSSGGSGRRSRTTTVNAAGAGTVENGIPKVVGDENDEVKGVKVTSLRTTDATEGLVTLKDGAKWEFGTATVGDRPSSVSSQADTTHGSAMNAVFQQDDDTSTSKAQYNVAVAASEPLQPILPSITGFDSPLHTEPSVLVATTVPASINTNGVTTMTMPSSDQLQMRLQQLSASSDSTPLVVGIPGEGPRGADAFEVKDYGYGLGPGSRGSTTPPDAPRQGQVQIQSNGGAGEGSTSTSGSGVVAPERDRSIGDYGRYTHKDSAKRDMEVPVRPRRWSGYHNAYGGGHDRSGIGEGRGGFSRGGNGGGRRGINGFGRGYGRRGGGSGGGGGGAAATAGYQAPTHHRPLPPFGVPSYPPIVNPMGDMAAAAAPGYYPMRPNLNLATYLPSGYEGYVPPMHTGGGPAAAHMAPPPGAPPVPVPISPISFPIDSTRWYLLGQLEYYLSPQNMAQDFYLRQRMDSRGWVPISVIASFNRVRQLTNDVQLVHDVLLLSSVVQVKDDWVRMNSWEQFVLPDAAMSTLGEDYGNQQQQQQGEIYHDERHGSDTSSASRVGEVYDEDEEEDVVFVMHHEGDGSATHWPNRPTT